MIRRLFLLIAGLSLFAAACTSEGLPSSYEDQENRAEKQFVAACEGTLEGEDEDGLCQCAFYTIASELTFDEFLELDNQLKDDAETLVNDFEKRNLIEDVTLPCEFTAEDIRS